MNLKQPSVLLDNRKIRRILHGCVNLKTVSPKSVVSSCVSHPTRMREFKASSRPVKMHRTWSHPTRMREFKAELIEGIKSKQKGRILHGCVNLKIAYHHTSRIVLTSHPTRMREFKESYLGCISR